MCIWLYQIFVQINILEGRAGYVAYSWVAFQSLFHIHSIVWQQKQEKYTNVIPVLLRI